MALQETDLNWAQQAMPDTEAAGFIDDAQQRIERFIRARQASEPIPSFVACDFVMVDRALAEIVDQRMAPGPVFCEWGAGFAVAAGLAALHGMGSYAIEIHRDLVEQAERLLRDRSIDVELVQGSLVPEGGDEIVDEMASQDWLKTNEHPAYDELGIDVSDIDLIFAYPWPGEEGLIEALFDAFAAEGALLLTYHGMNEMKLQRKVHGDF
ncbi:MAG: hypothetical protein KTR15_03730 [Phycisphaeraceae bacterium]|nr:hypothetical protein [Phycisphaeraceae bacterium]